MTLNEFFDRLPKDGWKLVDGAVVRIEDNWRCPRLMFDDEDKLFDEKTNSYGWTPVFAAADNDTHHRYFDPQLRARLLEHCGLTEEETTEN